MSDEHQRRGRRRRGQPRKVTVGRKHLTREELAIGAKLYPAVQVDRPRTRGECAGVTRPCVFVACRHNLYLDVSPETGSLTLNFPNREPSEMASSCALDEAERGGLTLEETGERLNLVRERIRQLEVKALLKIRGSSQASSLAGDEDPWAPQATEAA